MGSFLTEFVATDERTVAWLTDVVGPSDTKALFMLDSLSGEPLGYMGLDFIDWGAGLGEADAIVRGAPAAPGTMSEALHTLMRWAADQLGLIRLGVRVRSDNQALHFYRKNGFRECHRVPLRRLVTEEQVCWIEDLSAHSMISLVHMAYEPRAGG